MTHNMDFSNNTVFSPENQNFSINKNVFDQKDQFCEAVIFYSSQYIPFVRSCYKDCFAKACDCIRYRSVSSSKVSWDMKEKY